MAVSIKVSEQACIVRTGNRHMRDRMTVTIEGAGEVCSLHIGVFVCGKSRSNNGPIEGLSAGEVWVEVDVGGQDEVFVVVFGGFTESDQVGGGG
jgi:hypothetical protein